MEKKFLERYFEDLKTAMSPNHKVLDQLVLAKDIFVTAQKKKKKVLVIGNGGSAAIASHM